MPFDQLTYIETKPDAFSLEGFLAWAKTKPPTDEYCLIDPNICVLAQYGYYLGYQNFGARSAYGYVLNGFHRQGLLPEIQSIEMGTPYTFGDVVNRCEKMIEKRKLLPT